MKHIDLFLRVVTLIVVAVLFVLPAVALLLVVGALSLVLLALVAMAGMLLWAASAALGDE